MLQSVLRALQLPDLRRRITFTLLMLLAFRLIAHIPVPNINPSALGNLQQALSNNQLAQLLNLFAGGALQQLSVASMGVYPYITATIIMQLLQPLIPALAGLAKEGEQGRMRLNRITFWITVPLAFLQAYGQTRTLEIAGGVQLFRSPFDIITNFLPTFTVLIVMTAGTMLLVWLGEQIQERGIGNGISVIIFAGIVSRLPIFGIQNLHDGERWGSAVRWYHRIHCDRADHNRWYCASARGAAPRSGAILEARAWQPGVWRPSQQHPAQSQYVGDDPAHFRAEHHHFSWHPSVLWLPRADCTG